MKICHPGPGLAKMNLPAKFEISISTHYKDVKIDANCGKREWFRVIMGHPRSMKIAPYYRVLTSSY